MNSLVMWMAEQICPWLQHFGFLSGAVPNPYLIGVAGWIFGGIGLLALMGISEHLESGKAKLREAKVDDTRPLLLLAQEMPVQHSQISAHNAGSGERMASLRHTRRRARRHRVIGTATDAPVDHALAAGGRGEQSLELQGGRLI